ncbi:tyrosine phosphatase family protein [Methyloceanibacter caenitepidi]|uniref:Mll1302 protein n=1 Tax=Methyloceanibacter caenitepidi TaxID=1384459 RepID=A0A0A8K3E7_9HYPH|nr:tyrosine protein phosphatase [Methyloceanibacter caenitepidi]BAQ16519.1 Mll1302 protein [Methyloceanibacter caenitepidi]
MDTLTFDSGHLAEPETMSPDTVLVCPLSHVQATVSTARVSHLVTLINGETLIDTPETIGQERHLRLAMNDIAEPRDGLVVPSADHVAKLIEFAADWDQKAPMLIHCWAGISRSTAGAFVVLCALNPHADEHSLARALRRASPTAYPNRRIVAIADEVLGRGGRMNAAVELIGRGLLAEEGKVFSLPAKHAA